MYFCPFYNQSLLSATSNGDDVGPAPIQFDFNGGSVLEVPDTHADDGGVKFEVCIMHLQYLMTSSIIKTRVISDSTFTFG